MQPVNRVLIAVAGIATLLAVTAYVRMRPDTVPRCDGCSVILISVDPLRADALHATGNPLRITPFLDSLVKRGTVFTQAVAVAPWTLPSAMSLMTGSYPTDHGIINKVVLLPDGTETPASLSATAPAMRTLAQEFTDGGWVTAGFAGGAALDPSYGFSKGFAAYESPGDFNGLDGPYRRALEFLRENGRKKYILFLQGFDVHGQYPATGSADRSLTDPAYAGSLTGTAAEQKALREEGVMQGRVPLTPRDVAFLRALYDAKVRRMDDGLKEFFGKASALTDLNRTVIVFTSDHGDEFYEHGRIDHGMTLFDEVVRIPLVMVVPGAKHRTVRQQVRNIDIPATLFALTGLTPSGAFRDQSRGESLIPAMEGKDLKLDAGLESSYRYAVFLRGVRSHTGWKYVSDLETGTTFLYAPSDETRNLAGTGNAMEYTLRNLLTGLYGSRRVPE